MIEAENLAKIDFVRHGFLNFAEAEAFKKKEAKHLILLKQIHKTDVIFASSVDLGEMIEADAMVSMEGGLLLGIKTADCVPLLLVDKKRQVVGAVHAGWRGALGGIVENTVSAMTRLGAKAEDMAAALGPAIGFASYEIGKEFYESFMKYDPEAEVFFTTDKKFFNLPAYVKSKLFEVGIEDIWDAEMDTFGAAGKEAGYVSFRRGASDSERNLAFVRIR